MRVDVGNQLNGANEASVESDVPRWFGGVWAGCCCKVGEYATSSDLERERHGDRQREGGRKKRQGKELIARALKERNEEKQNARQQCM